MNDGEAIASVPVTSDDFEYEVLGGGARELPPAADAGQRDRGPDEPDHASTGSVLSHPVASAAAPLPLTARL